MAEAEREFDETRSTAKRHGASWRMRAGNNGRILSFRFWSTSEAADEVVIAENCIRSTSFCSGWNKAVDDGRM